MDNSGLISRYSRLVAIDGFGEEGIEKLRDGKVMVVGCGALGSLCAMYLAASGIGRTGVADFDTVDISNLQRQLFFDEQSVGMLKVDLLAKRMAAINSEVEIDIFRELITAEKAADLFRGYDCIIDGSDNAATKLMTSQICETLGIPYCIGGVNGFSGQAVSWAPGHLTYRELFGEETDNSGLLPCSLGGVLGPTAGVTASVLAAEAIKIVTGVGVPLYDRIFSFDLASPSANIFLCK